MYSVYINAITDDNYEFNQRIKLKRKSYIFEIFVIKKYVNFCVKSD